MISVVVPAYNEGAGIQSLHERVSAAAQHWGEDWELIIVDDGSRDDTLSICQNIAARDPRLRVVSLSRNFGHQAAITAGLRYSSGGVIAVIDADLQDPPEELIRFIDRCREGFDVVYAIRTKRKEGYFKRLGYFFYYRMLKSLASLDIPLDAGDFCVMNRRVLDALNRLPERNRFVRGLRTWVGYRQTGLAYERHARQEGKPKYTLGKLARLGMDGIVDFSYRPLHFVMVAGVLTGMFGVVAAVAVVVMYLTDTTIGGYNPRQAQGWTSLILSILLMSAIQLFALGIVGEYIGRLFEEIKARPPYIVRELLNFDENVG
jgi:polyisoprenyl-phosphate glycosyltransferase